MFWRICWLPVAAALAAQPAQAQSVGYDEALRAAQTQQPVLQARVLEVEALERTAAAAGELPDPRLRAGIVNLPVTGPAAFDLDRQLPTQVQIGLEQDFPNLAKRHARTGVAESDIRVADARLAHTEHMVRIETGEAWISLAYAQQRLALAARAQENTRLRLRGAETCVPASA